MKATELFTQEQIINFNEYERIRQLGEYNMFDRRARQKTNMTSDEWVFCMSNYDDLQAAASKGNKHP